MMNKKGLVILGALVVTLLGAFVCHSEISSLRTKDLGRSLGHDLVSAVINGKTISSMHAIFIGENLRRALQDRREEFIRGYKIQCFSGDSRYGDNKAQYHLVISSEEDKKIVTLRLKYDKSLEKFDVLGFVTSR